jgi:hypothetical protein
MNIHTTGLCITPNCIIGCEILSMCYAMIQLPWLNDGLCFWAHNLMVKLHNTPDLGDFTGNREFD